MTVNYSCELIDRTRGYTSKNTKDHSRVSSQSTVASTASIEHQGTLRGIDRVRKPATIKTRKNVRTEAALRRKEASIGKVRNCVKNGWEQTSRTPSAGNLRAGKPGGVRILCSPGGTDYLMTPGKHKISMTEFVSNVDKTQSAEGIPALRALAHYQENMLRAWMDRENAIDKNIYMLSFKEGTALEQFRQMAIQSVFQYAIEHKLHEKTVHLTCFNISRLIFHQLTASNALNDAGSLACNQSLLTHSLFAKIVVTSLRHAIKSDECFDKSELFRIDPQHVWNTCCYLRDAAKDRSEVALNRLEMEILPVLDSPANPPLGPEFLDRYLSIGQWPEYQLQYRELASYLIGLALFANTCNSPLRSTPHSRIAAAALVLSVKVINTDQHTTKYEYWPLRLQQYTEFTMEDLKPTIRAIATLLRHKPRWSQILERYYGRWSEYDWN